MFRWLAKLSLLVCFSAAAQDLSVVQIYKQDELLNWIKKNQHLTRVVEDECQLVEDIKARATVMKVPAYQFLYGDMLAYGVCIEKDAELGVYYMKLSANQGLAEALEQLGRYLHIGRFMQKDVDEAIIYLREAAALGNVKAQMRLVQLFVDGYGSPYDYEDAYRWLHHAIIADKQQFKQAESLLAALAERMPDNVVKRAKRAL